MRAVAVPLSLVCLLALLSFVRPVLAWSASGHMQIALYAYDRLPEAQRRGLDQILALHPRFQEDFVPKIPGELSGEARARHVFALAATWPDVARGQPEYEHSTWHYVNLPLYLRGSLLSSCREARVELPRSRAVALAAAGKAAQAQDSILEAFEWAERTWSDRERPGAERAVALSWLLHLAGDAHQPLHGVALFTPTHFSTGDRGGNDVIWRGKGSLHRVWDGLLGDEVAPVALDRRVQELSRERGLTRVARVARHTLQINDWIDEGCELARSFVYVPAVLGAVKRFEREQRAGKPEVSLVGPYLDAARRVARQRAVMAGARLEALLRAGAGKSPAQPEPLH